MKTSLILIFLLSAGTLSAQPLDGTVLAYFSFLFEEDVSKSRQPELELGEPMIGRFSSRDGKKMLVVSAPLKMGKSYYVLMSYNERNMGYLAWKARGFGLDPAQDQRDYMRFDGKAFDYGDW